VGIAGTGVNSQADTPSFLGGSVVRVFVNSRAGRRRANRYLPQIQRLFDLHRVDARFVSTESSAELETSAREAISEGQRVLFAMGGDGTFQGLVNAAFGTEALLGILPLGGGNDFAAALGLPKDPVRAAERVLRERPRLVDLVRVRMADGRTRLYAGGGGIGLDALAARYASGAYRRFPGRSRYIASALRALAGFRPLEVRVEFPDGENSPIEEKVLLAAVLNTPTYGAGLRLAPGALVDDGLFHIVLIKDIHMLGVLRLLPRLMASGELQTSSVLRWQASKVRLLTREPTEFHGDGEILGKTPVDIELVKGAVKVLAPQN